jgi:hypothetical protein
LSSRQRSSQFSSKEVERIGAHLFIAPVSQSLRGLILTTYSDSRRCECCAPVLFSPFTLPLAVILQSPLAPLSYLLRVHSPSCNETSHGTNARVQRKSRWWKTPMVLRTTPQKLGVEGSEGAYSFALFSFLVSFETEPSYSAG